ncbi:hypothetical protein JHK85_010554 [Glycine max]|nr:hypothetical protein JHK85_010554 [Glycine max]
MMSSWQVVKHAKYKTTVKDPVTPDVLKLTQDKFVFKPNDPTSKTKLDVEFRFIQESTNPLKLESLFSRLPNMFNIVILSIDGYFGQADVLGLPDTGG